MAVSRKKKVVKIRKYRRPINIGVLIFALIFLYVLIYTVTYLSKERISSVCVFSGVLQVGGISFTT